MADGRARGRMGRKVDIICANGLLERIAIDAFIINTQVFRFDETFRSVRRRESRRDAHRLGTYDFCFATRSYGIHIISIPEEAVERQPQLRCRTFTSDFSPLRLHLERIWTQYDGSGRRTISSRINNACGDIPRETGKYRYRQSG